tara:strand:- start:2245 stop:3186 length:942 start_codon:yes stop_codon:yes gene_type:complete
MTYDSKSDIAPDERFVDAALREQARLGSVTNDQALVTAILEQTVQPSHNEESSTPLNSSRDRSLWIAASIAAVATISLVALVLAQFPYRNSSSAIAEEIHFSVRFMPTDGETPAEPPTAPAFASAEPYSSPVIPSTSLPGSASQLPASDAVIEITTSFGPTLESLPPRPIRRDIFRIAADHSSREGNRIVYSGNVRIEHDEFLIEAVEAHVRASDSTSRSSEPQLTAHEVILTQFNPNRTARAGQITFDPTLGSFILTNVRRLETAEGVLGRFEDSDRLVISSNRFSIETGESIAGPQIEDPASYAAPLPVRP